MDFHQETLFLILSRLVFFNGFGSAIIVEYDRYLFVFCLFVVFNSKAAGRQLATTTMAGKLPALAQPRTHMQEQLSRAGKPLPLI